MRPFVPWSSCVAQPTWPFGLSKGVLACLGRNLGMGRHFSPAWEPPSTDITVVDLHPTV